MFIEILIAIFIGIFFGCITGLTPGIHINLISLLLLSISGSLLAYTSPLTLCIFIISMAITHTFLDTIPATFLGAPDGDTALMVLPAHQLLLKGMGYEAVKLTVIGSLFSLIITTVTIPLMLPIIPTLYEFLKPYIGYILLSVVIFMILKDLKLKKIFWNFTAFTLSGVLGLIVLNLNMSQPLFPLLSGLFGVSGLIISLSQKVEIPKQRITEHIKVEKKDLTKALSAGSFAGILTGFFPALGAAQASIIGSQIARNISTYGFMIMLGGINTVNFLFSLATLFTLEKARNGAIVVVLKIIQSITYQQLILFLSASLVAGGIATFLALFITRIFSKLITKINYPLLCIGIISLIFLISFLFDGFLGLFVLITSTALGIFVPLSKTARNHMMGCLMLPVILFFLL